MRFWSVLFRHTVDSNALDPSFYLIGAQFPMYLTPDFTFSQFSLYCTLVLTLFDPMVSLYWTPVFTLLNLSF